ncbi:MAG: DUF4121 family protein [Proteobacteria bacterium]|nr:DUF4121 family protein [Pseudomonadota bacterium]MBU1541460.1 DUF4121 family protein [Pseudomonadota bacterium]MBU2480296.1 DUF4121 family protein [Pseudomonadota bacterium]
MEKIKKTDLKSIAANGSFIQIHGIHALDIELANRMHDLIVNTRNPERPTAGDIIICCSERAIYENGHLETDISDDYSSICTEPYTPFVFEGEKNKPSFSTSGGYWLSETDIEKYEAAGQRKKLFCSWGHSGACASGAIHFEAQVNVWKLFRKDIY